jgi:hypothetical protein
MTYRTAKPVSVSLARTPLRAPLRALIATPERILLAPDAIPVAAGGRR